MEITVTRMNCTHRGAPRRSATIAVNVPVAINRKVISPVTTCALTSNSITMSQKAQKFSRTHSITMASHMRVHTFRILVAALACRHDCEEVSGHLRSLNYRIRLEICELPAWQLLYREFSAGTA